MPASRLCENRPPPPRGAAVTRAQVTQHLQLEPPPAWLTGYNIPRAVGRRAKGFSSLAQPQEAQRGRSGMLLLGFQKLLQFL